MNDKFDKETNSILQSGQWTGFFLESHRDDRGWMHLYLNFGENKVLGEGTDYVGPWHIQGTYDLKKGRCLWRKQYLKKHEVIYQGEITEKGILGTWELSHRVTTGQFHIWPQRMYEMQHLYLQQDMPNASPERQSNMGWTPNLSH